MISLQQDADGFIRMTRHFPRSAQVSVKFTDGSAEQFSGVQINAIYDEAQTVFRAENHLDEKGYSRAPAKTVRPTSTIGYVAVSPGMPRP